MITTLNEWKKYNESFRYRNQRDWSKMMDELVSFGWNKEGDTLYKEDVDENDEEVKYVLELGQHDQLCITKFGETDSKLQSGSWDAEGESAGEIDSNCWNYLFDVQD